MVKMMIFPYNDQFKQFAFDRSAPQRIPFYVNELGVIRSENSKIIICYLPDDMIAMYLLANEAGVDKYIDATLTNANWLAISQSNLEVSGSISVNPGDNKIQLINNSALSPTKRIDVGSLTNKMSISGSYRKRCMTLGEIDPFMLVDIDIMLML